jgi:hypothetical protein
LSRYWSSYFSQLIILSGFANKLVYGFPDNN